MVETVSDRLVGTISVRLVEGHGVQKTDVFLVYFLVYDELKGSLLHDSGPTR